MECIIELTGNPVGKERPRKGKYGFYTPNKTRDFENRVKEAFKKTNCKPFEGYMNIFVEASFEIAESDPKWKKKAKMLGILNPHRIDVDNILKAVLDGLQGVAFQNDDKVVMATVVKRYAKEPGMKISIIGTEPIEERVRRFRNDIARDP